MARRAPRPAPADAAPSETSFTASPPAEDVMAGGIPPGPERVEEFFRDAPTGLIDALPAGVCVTFELSSDDWERSWTLRRDDEGVGRIVARAPSPCDCRLACTAEDFVGLITGGLDPREGFIEGRLDVEGDVGLVLQLHRCLVS